MSAVLFLQNGQSSLVDEDLLSWVSSKRWRAVQPDGRTDTWYVARTEGRSTIYLHRLIAMAPPTLQVDHINGDGLDNRRSNLRLATKPLNCANTRIKLPVSGFRGVYPHGGKFVAEVFRSSRRVRVGVFASAEEAARARDMAAREIYGEFAVLNFSEGTA